MNKKAQARAWETFAPRAVARQHSHIIASTFCASLAHPPARALARAALPGIAFSVVAVGQDGLDDVGPPDQQGVKGRGMNKKAQLGRGQQATGRE